MEEKRRFHRIAYQAPGTITIDNCSDIKVSVSDLSIHGALFCAAAPQEIKEGEHCNVCIFLTPDLEINFQATIARIIKLDEQNIGIGVQCDSIGLEDITNIRTLVTLNSSDPALLERDLAELVR